MYFASFITQSGYGTGWVLTGAALAAALILALGGLFVYAISRIPLLTRIAATALLLTGSVWFVIRLRS